MRILITGGAGFVGHHFVEHVLKNTSWDVVVLDALSYAGSLKRITDIDVYDPKKVKFVWHDLRAPIFEAVSKLIGELVFIVHFAAESHVDRSLESSIPFVESNVLGTANLVEWIKHKHPSARTLIFSTDEVFGAAPEGVYYKEEDCHRPSNPYAASKSGAEMMAYSFAHAFKLPISIVRSMNIIGERQHPEKFIPKTIRAILNNEKVVLHGESKDIISSRCWIHARNVADGLLFLLEKGKPEEFYHIVGEEQTCLEIANSISFHINKRPLRVDEIDFVDFHKARPGHDRRYAMSGEKMQMLGWSPPKDLNASLLKTVLWTMEHQEWLEVDDAV